MKVDKQNQNVCYNDEKHMYWDENGVYVSVTTLIGKFCQDFDKDFWSGYKALEKMLSAEEFKAEKSQLLKTHKINLKYFYDTYDFNKYYIFNRNSAYFPRSLQPCVGLGGS